MVSCVRRFRLSDVFSACPLITERSAGSLIGVSAAPSYREFRRRLREPNLIGGAAYFGPTEACRMSATEDDCFKEVLSTSLATISRGGDGSRFLMAEWALEDRLARVEGLEKTTIE